MSSWEVPASHGPCGGPGYGLVLRASASHSVREAPVNAAQSPSSLKSTALELWGLAEKGDEIIGAIVWGGRLLAQLRAHTVPLHTALTDPG